MKRRIMLISALILVIFSGCAREKTVLPNRTSTEADIYLLGDGLCDRSGEPVEGYSFDESGNLLAEDGAVYIASANLAPFTWTEGIAFDSGNSVTVLLTTSELEEQVYSKPTDFSLKLRLANPEVINQTVFIESTDPGALTIPTEGNESVLESVTGQDGAFTDGMKVIFKEDGSAELRLICRLTGEAELICRNYLGEEIGRCAFIMKAESSGSETKDDAHAHQFEATVVPPTEKTQGYTLHVCSECGFNYRDDFVDKLPCSHTYTERIVAPTYTEKGYTIHSCTKCGDTYRDSETEVLHCQHENMVTTVVEPTCTYGGYTIHECMSCRNYRYEDTKTEPLGHSWDQGKTTKEASCGAKGLKTYNCTRCPATKTEEIPATGKHTYTLTTVNPTCTENGYDAHTCSCGDSYTDNLVPMLGHAELRWEITQQPDCGHSGVRAGTCTRCGCIVSSETLSPSGSHSYVITTVDADCEHGGYTEHRCSICGDTYTDGTTAALGHAWVESTEQVMVGMEIHTFCSVCGFDFTANGGYNSAHGKAHALAGEGAGSYQSTVEKYETITTYTCTRCGATK